MTITPKVRFTLEIVGMVAVAALTLGSTHNRIGVLEQRAEKHEEWAEKQVVKKDADMAAVQESVDELKVRAAVIQYQLEEMDRRMDRWEQQGRIAPAKDGR